MKKSDNKILYLEAIRILAGFLVLFTHTSEKGFFLFANYNPNSINFWIYLFISIISQIAILLFFGISGSQLIPKDESLKDIWKKRILKYFIILLLFSFIHYFYVCNALNINFDLKSFFLKFYTGNINVSLWFLYAYLAYLIFLPFLRQLARNLSNKNYCYLFVIAFIFQGVVPIIQYLLFNGEYVISRDFDRAWFLNIIVFYPMIGYFINDRLDVDKLKKKLWILWIVNVITILIACFATYYKVMITGDASEATTQVFHHSFGFINGFTVFSTFKCLFSGKKVNKILKKVILSLGSCIFGIYLIHLFLMYHIPIDNFLDNFNLNPMVEAFLYCLVIMLLSYFIVATYKIILYLIKKLIHKK